MELHWRAMSDSEPPTADDAPSQASTEAKPKDVVFVHGPTPNGLGIARMRTDEDGDDRIELGELRPLKEGQPLLGEVVRLSKREESDRLFDVDVIMKPPAAPAARALDHKGPPRVTSNAFRSHWDDVFGPKNKPKALPS